MLAPKRQKYRKQFRGTFRKIAVKGDKLNFGFYGLKAMKSAWIKDREIESARVIFARGTRKVVSIGLEYFRINHLPKSHQR